MRTILAFTLVLVFTGCGAITASGLQVNTSGSTDDGDVDTAPDTAIDTGEPCEELTWYHDADADGYGDATSLIEDCDQPTGYVEDATDCNDAEPTINPGSGEWCNLIDDDCDGTIDENAFTVWYTDADGDSFGDELTETDVVCEGASGTLVAPRDVTGDDIDDFDCNDADASIYPLADEFCDGVDNNCDSLVDDTSAVDVSTWYHDGDEDGYGDAGSTYQSCEMPHLAYSADSTDCDDTDASVNPGASEVCDEVDNDCDGSVPSDELDDDLDGVSECLGDCDDASIDAYPGASETCNSIDDDCDGTTDESDASDVSTFYADTDGDGYGDASASFVSCEAPIGYVEDATDCDDGNAAANTAATEVCDEVDNDCDGDVDESDASDAGVWYLDSDADGYGDGTSFEVACDQPSGYVEGDDDCDDTDATVNPGVSDTADDGIDNDCSGTVDDGAASCFPDVDNDGYGDSTGGISEESGTCPSGYVEGNGDCDDSNDSYNPGAFDSPFDLTDWDCDGAAD